jgi:shikimate kinase
MKKNIVLVGFMGCGKSKVSRNLQARLNLPRFSTDRIIEEREGRKIPVIFKNFGEAYFRRKEADVVREVARQEGAIIDCGGGVVVNPVNLRLLRKNGILFYLEASPECLLENLKSGKVRPLLQVKDPLREIKKLINARRAFYEKAHYRINADFKTIPNIGSQIIAILSKL